MKIIIARCKGGCSDTNLIEWVTDTKGLAKRLKSTKIGHKDGEYFVRAPGVHRSTETLGKTAGVLVLDNDSRIDDNGEIKSGAPDPADITSVLTKLGVPHILYSSYSNGATEAEQANKHIDSGGRYGPDYHKYRVVIPCQYTPEQLPALLDHLFAELHREGVMLCPVNENKTWAQPWYFPRVPDKERLDLFTFYQHDSGTLDVEAIYSQWQIDQQAIKKRIAEQSAASMVKATKRIESGLDPIKAYIECYPIEQSFDLYGYKKLGKKWLSPHSKTGVPGVTIIGKKWFSKHGSDAEMGAPHEKGGRFGDAFDLFVYFEHGGNYNQAVIAAGDMFRTASGKTINQTVQREHMQAKSVQQPKHSSDTPMKDPEIDYSTMPDYDELPPMGYAKPPESKQTEDKTPFTLAQFSISGDSREMRKQMLGTKYIIDRIAIRGQSTVIFAKYNTGKTLLVLRGVSQSIEKGVIDGNDVYYINADDDFDGLTTKTEIAEHYGFHMLTPGFKDFNPSAMQGYMRQMIEDGTAEKSVLILDTLKKFIDQMGSKSKQSEFTTRMGEFITARGTVIMLSHVNKNRDENGKVVHCGTSDIPDDASCVFMLDEITTTKNRKQVLFENIKNRGLVARELAFSYSIEEGQTYRQIFDSVQVETEASSAQAKIALDESIKFERDKAVINSITEIIKAGIVNKTELIKAVHEDTGKSKPRITSTLNEYCGKKWQSSTGDKNAKIYTLITNNQSTENEYRRYKSGE